jgi:uncharacterized protein (TIGR02421 family)
MHGQTPRPSRGNASKPTASPPGRVAAKRAAAADPASVATRRALQHGGRLDVDRPLPFLVLGRHEDDRASLARRLALISAAGIAWPASDAADAEVRREVARLLRAAQAGSGRGPGAPLLVWLHDLPCDASLGAESARLERFEFTLAASGDAATRQAQAVLADALARLRVDQRTASVRTEPAARAPDALTRLLSRLDRAGDGVAWLALGLPQVHRVPGSDTVYPQLFHELESGVFDALLRALAAHMAASGLPAPAHHRALGRSRFLDAALEVDRRLSAISASFDFLLGVSPIDTVAAFARFRAAGEDVEPTFHYRPLPIDPAAAKGALHAIDVRACEDPLLESLLSEKQRELDQQLTMLQTRNTPSFRYASLLQYGGVDDELLDDARSILRSVHDDGRSLADEGVDCFGVRDAAQALIDRYRARAPAFDAEVCLRDDIAPGLMVTGRSLLVSTATLVPRRRLDALLQHEVSVHVLTAVNGRRQGLGVFGSGLAGYEGVQEGLGVFAELVVGGLTPARLRLLAGRVVAVDAMIRDATFIETYRLLRDEHGFRAQPAFNLVARVFRSGGMAKDAIYLRGLRQVLAIVAAHGELAPFWLGKIAASHVAAVDELRVRGLLRAPLVAPEFLDRPDVAARIERIRGGATLLDLTALDLNSPSPTLDP